MQEIYIDNVETAIEIKSSLSEKESPDSSGGPRTYFQIVRVSGSKSQYFIDQFHSWHNHLDSMDISKEEKNSEYYEYLKKIVNSEIPGKIKAYLIAGRGYLFGSGFMFGGNFPLTYSQVLFLSKLLDSSLNKTYEVDNIKRLLVSIQKEKNRDPGKPFHSVTLSTPDGHKATVDEFKKKLTIIDLWASWCAPCRTANKELITLYKKYKNQGLQIIGVSLDEDYNKWKAALKMEKYPWPQLIDPKEFSGEISNYYDVRSIPTKIILDSRGNVVSFTGSNEEINEIVRSILASGEKSK